MSSYAPLGEAGKPSGRVHIDGAIVAAHEARVDVFDRGFLYGDSVYEVLRTFGGKPHALDEHLARLEGSARRIGLPVVERDRVIRAVLDTVAAARDELAGADVYVRIMVTRGSAPIGHDPGLALDPRLIVMALPLHLPDAALYHDGAEVAIVGAKRNAPGGVDPMAKSGNYLTSVMALADARARGAYEALMCDPVGRLAEGSSSNIFVVRGGRVQTPPLSVGLLEGITRRHVIALARGLGIPVDEAPIWPVDLHGADEAFITSSIRGVMPIARVDGRNVGEGRPGEITRQIMAAYLEETQRAS